MVVTKQSMLCALSLVLASCNAFDAKLLAPRGTGGHGGDPLDGGRDDDGDVHPRDASTDMQDAGARDAEVANDASVDASLDASDVDATDTDADVDPDAGDDAGDAADDAGSCALASTSDYCSELPALETAPVIDGVLDCGPTLQPIPTGSWNGTGALPAGHAAQLAFAHRPDGLYAYVEVHGAAPAQHPSSAAIYCGDAVELYVDADAVLASDGVYDVPGTMQILVAAPASAAAPNPHAERFRQGTSQGAWTSTQYALTWLADGYAVEAFIAAADLDLATWATSGSIGIDLVIDVAGPAASPDLRCGLQLGQYFLRLSTLLPSSCNGEPWCDTRAFCAPTLQ